MQYKKVIPGAGALALLATPVLAHHSFAMFDTEKTLSLEGSVKKLQWTNPHSWVYLTVDGAPGSPVDWVIELGSPGQLVRQGWTPTTLTSGTMIKVLIHPLRDGRPGGQFVSATLPDGHKLGESSEPTLASPQGK